MKKIYLLLTLFVLACSAQAQTIYYVKISSGNDANAGTTWGNAFRNFTKALAVAKASSATEVQIWVAEGTYTPEDGVTTLPSDHKDTAFALYRGDGVGKALKVYGGFAGSESSIGMRDTLHPTIFDGIISTGNSYHVGVISGLAAGADSVVLDHITFSNGTAFGGISNTKDYNGILIYRSFGGGLTITGNSSPKIAIRNCSFAANSATITGSGLASGYGAPIGAGGAVYIVASVGCLFDQCKFNDNYTQCNSVDFYTSYRYGGNGYGGALYINSDNVKVRHSIFDNNKATGSSVYYSGWGYYWGGAGMGGAIAIMSANGCQIDGCKFTRDRAQPGLGDQIGQSSGGAIYANASHAVVNNSSFYSCNCNDTGLIYYYSYSYTACGDKFGGAISSNGSACKFDNNYFGNNYNISYATGNTYGGAIHSGSSTDTISNCTIINNTSTNGGGIASSGSVSYIVNNSIRLNNSANGAIYTSNALPTIINCPIDSNNGPGISNNTSVTHVVSCAITNNGGGIVSKYSNLFLDTCVFRGNTADYGGALNTVDSFVSPKHCLFSNNTANYEGGAVYCGTIAGMPSSFKSNGNVFEQNKAGKGGAISVNACTTCNDTLLNNVFTGNKSSNAGSGGGAIAVGASRNYIFNNTFLSDTAVGRGGAIRVEGTGGLARIANNIFYKGVATATSVDTSLAGTGTIVFYNNIYSSTNPQFTDTTNFAGADNTWATADDGARLKPCSAGINGGNNAYVLIDELYDILGNLRINESITDIGAYENSNTGTINGPSSLCVGAVVTYTDTTAGGIWSSSAPTIVTVSATGVVTALAQGTATLSYTAGGVCGGGALSTARLITVDRPVSAIVGTDTICVGSTSLLIDSAINGVWSSTNPLVAGINVNGLVTAVAQGVDTVSYSVTNVCGTSTARRRLVIQRPVSVVSGNTAVCRGSLASFSDSTIGGVWSVSNNTVATVNALGVVTAVAAGADSVIYTVSNVCGTSMAYAYLTVERQPSAISCPDSVCEMLGWVIPTDSVNGGIWHVSNSSVLSLFDTMTGVFDPLVIGHDTLTYTVNNSCGLFTVSKLVTVDGYVSGVISGPDTVCMGSTALMTDTFYSAGAWSVDLPGIATINSTGSVTAVSGGLATVSYSLTNTCGFQTALHPVYVKTPPTGVIISGLFSVCLGGNITLVGSPAGGSWNAVNANASVFSTGTVLGLAVGVDTIQYSVSNSCGTTTFPRVINIITVPSPAIITGADTVCQGSVVTLSASATGGAWSHLYGYTTVTGTGRVNGVTPGIDTIKYTLSNACGSAVTAFPITVYSIGHCDSANGVNNVVANAATFSVYPNPARSAVTFNMQSQSHESVVITLSNIVGEKVKEWTIQPNVPSEQDLDLVPGVYVVTAIDGNVRYVTRLVVE